MCGGKKNEPPLFGDAQSYTLHVFTGRASMTTASLTALLNDFLFSYDGAPLKDLEAETRGNRLKLSGKLKKGVEVPFSVVSDKKHAKRWTQNVHAGLRSGGRDGGTAPWCCQAAGDEGSITNGVDGQKQLRTSGTE